jgi:Ca2+-binding EF-hand superfamily protein
MGNTEFPSQFTDKEIQKLYNRFQEIDNDKSGDLDP